MQYNTEIRPFFGKQWKNNDKKDETKRLKRSKHLNIWAL